MPLAGRNPFCQRVTSEIFFRVAGWRPPLARFCSFSLHAPRSHPALPFPSPPYLPRSALLGTSVQVATKHAPLPPKLPVLSPRPRPPQYLPRFPASPRVRAVRSCSTTYLNSKNWSTIAPPRQSRSIAATTPQPFHLLRSRISSRTISTDSLDIPFSSKTDVAATYAMTEVGPADRTRFLRSKRDEFKSVSPASESAPPSDHFDTIFDVLTPCSSIVTSRKRKLRQLYESATPNHGAPNATFANPNGATTSPAELQFLYRCDILKYVSVDAANTILLKRCRDAPTILVYLFEPLTHSIGVAPSMTNTSRPNRI